MQLTLIIVIAIHVVSGVFWAGSTFAAARIGGGISERLFKPQMGAATVAVISGVLMWGLLHHGMQAPSEKMLALGALTAIIAAGNQGITVGRARRQLAQGEAEAAAHARMTIGQRASAGLLAITVVCMAIARFI